MSITAVPHSTASSTSTPVTSPSSQIKTSSNLTAQQHTQADRQSQVNMQMEGEREVESKKKDTLREPIMSNDGRQTPSSGVEEAVQPTGTSHINAGNG